MAKCMKDYFPMIRTRKEVQHEILKSQNLQELYDSWEEDKQKEFLDFCCGARGVKVLYDSFFKEILSPEFHPDRLEELLMIFLGKKVKIVQILPNDSIRIADESTLLITDIVVELEDGSIANVEIQKIGYAFPGTRCACYSADLLLRQYKRVRNRKKKNFSYRDIKTVYTIVLFEKSTSEFKQCKEDFIHHGSVIFDTDLPLRIPQEYILIPLDIFKQNMQNKPITNMQEAWLSFLSFDEPERMIEIIEKYPDFKARYGEIYEICQNVERVMDMFSKELMEMDRNTVRYMIEEQQAEIDQKNEQLGKQDQQIEQQDQQIEQQKQQLENQQREIELLKESIRKIQNSN
ncbi:MAG: PD-(D/E)XK nuclease family transposase [Lachnospiraceae bacterium]|nr:PD-(D/E)XK nuclease family transposase [Lachnospiraceae bacterium]